MVIKNKSTTFVPVTKGENEIVHFEDVSIYQTLYKMLTT